MQDKAIVIVRNYIDQHLEKTDPVQAYTLYVVWFAFTLGNWKTLISTTLPDGMYYEVTYNCALDEIYLDVYKKFHNQKFDGGIPISSLYSN